MGDFISAVKTQKTETPSQKIAKSLSFIVTRFPK